MTIGPILEAAEPGMPAVLYADEGIEILGLDIFETHAQEIEIVDSFRERFDAALGWHYHLDIAWILRHVSVLPKGALLLDAGAGSGILQFILSELGYNVVSVDFMSRQFSTGYARRYAGLIHTLNSQSDSIVNAYTKYLMSFSSRGRRGLFDRLSRYLRKSGNSVSPASCIDEYRYTPDKDISEVLPGADETTRWGRIFLYKADVGHMPLLPDGTVDPVVSVSALEHNDRAGFENCVSELLRVTKPSGKLFVTVSASQADDWFHEQSKGWCYSEKSLKQLFRLEETSRSNFSRKDHLFSLLKTEGNQLHKRLSRAYFESGNNGMPWGVWNPRYQPVGIIKTKH